MRCTTDTAQSNFPEFVAAGALTWYTVVDTRTGRSVLHGGYRIAFATRDGAKAYAKTLGEHYKPVRDGV